MLRQRELRAYSDRDVYQSLLHELSSTGSVDKAVWRLVVQGFFSQDVDRVLTSKLGGGQKRVQPRLTAVPAGSKLARVKVLE